MRKKFSVGKLLIWGDVMNFEILTQSQEIIKIIVENDFDKFFKLDGLQIYSGDILLGKYDTFKRAKEVYDELFTAWVTNDQNFLMPEV